MQDNSRFVGNSIEELLVALAEGVREAQIALNAGPLTDVNGRPLATYHLPYLDFAINVEVATVVRPGGRPVALLFTKLPAQDGESRQIRSTITGRLVATPPGDGLPIPRIRMAAAPPSDGRARISIEVSNTAGEQLPGQLVELNIDDAASQRLSDANGAPDFSRAANTRLQQALVVTDADGNASAVLDVGEGQPTNAVIVVTAAIGTVTAATAIPLGAAS